MLNREEIKNLVEDKKLIEGYFDLDCQLTPNGFDLTVGNVSKFSAPGALDFSNKERYIPESEEILPKKRSESDNVGWWNLPKGVYKIKTNEIINLSDDLIAMAFTRTSLLRMGVFAQNGVWDAGFKGKSEFLLIVENPWGVWLKQNSRIVQLLFKRIHQTQKYNGIYNGLT